ncbi:hypothetical protein KFU94_45675 [Chloroflexi bacterium TSY]|nr:hypothetical protein [Chloroflexi bacterium TSY]
MGILLLESPYAAAFDEEEKENVLAIARQARIAIERADLTAELRFKTSVIGATSWAADIAHDINRETGRIRNRVYWLKQESNIAQASRHYLDEIDSYAKRLAGTAAKTSFGPEELSPLALHSHLYKWVEEAIDKRDVDIVTDYEFAEEDLQVSAHPMALSRSIYDLVRNALEAMGWAKQQRLIVRTCLTQNEQIEIRIEDNGPGIDPLVAPKIFHQPASTKGEGRGVGLLFIRAAIENMGGSIRYIPKGTDQGSVFAITLQKG